MIRSGVTNPTQLDRKYMCKQKYLIKVPIVTDNPTDISHNKSSFNFNTRLIKHK